MNHRTGKLRVRLTVADTGVGMSPEVLSRVFGAFYTTRGSSVNGLGLWDEEVRFVDSSQECHGQGAVFHPSFEGAESTRSASV
jgi:sensor histidine kinase regulating citrate/malate metabolism